MTIQSFGDTATEEFFNHGTLPKRCPWKPIAKVAERKLDMLQAAMVVEDMRVPPSNRLELLKGDLAGLYSIRINQRWRIVFRWLETDVGPHEVQIMDYH